MPKKDFSQIAFDAVRRATGEAPKPAPAPTKKAAPKAARLTPEKRSEIAKNAANDRWAKSAKKSDAAGAGLTAAKRKILIVPLDPN